MAKLSTYTGRIYHINDETTEPEIISSLDLTALPYEKFNAEEKLFIVDKDVVIEKGKQNPLPDFTNVVISGCFDCSSYTITQDTVLPSGITELKCLHSIQNLGVLQDKLPPSVHTVTVRTAILNAIKNNKDDALAIAKNFVQKYPNIVVTDGKSVLSNILADMETIKEKVITPKIQEKTVQVTVEKKNDNWMSAEEIVNFVLQDFRFQSLTTEEIARLVRQSKSAKSQLKLNKCDMMREDNTVINCVHKDELPKILDFIQRQNERNNKKETNTVVDTKESNKTIKNTDTPKFFVGNKEVQETVIKKFIKNSVWKEIEKHCKNNIDKQLEFLYAIDIINIRPVDTAGKQVCYIQDGVLKTSSTITFKNAQWLSQGFGTLDDRARITWCMNNDTLIATEYFEEHEKKQSIDYKKTIRQKDVSGFTTEDSVSVSELIKILTAERDKKNTDITDTTTPDTTTKATNSITSNTKNVVDAVKPIDTKPTQIQPQRKRGRPRNATEKVTSISSESQKIRDQVAFLQLETMPENDIQWTDYDSLHASFIVKIQSMNTECSSLLKQIKHEKNTDTALKYTQQLQHALIKKRRYEKALDKLNLLNQQLQNLKQEYINDLQK